MTAAVAVLLAGLALVAPGCGHEESPPLAPSIEPAAQAPAQEAEIPGRWRQLRPERLDPELDAEQRELVARLESIGYASGSQPAPAVSGVTVNDPARAWSGLNFYTSGHAPEALLVDMQGKPLHRWHYKFLDAFPDFPEAWLTEGAEFWRRAHLYENGDVLAIFEGLGLIKLDASSKLLWASPLRAHHDLEVLPNGDIVVLTRRAHMRPHLDPEKPILEDFITVLDANGKDKRSVSLLAALERSDFSDLWQPNLRLFGDVFHTNTVSVLDGRLESKLPGFRAGNVLVSLLVPDLIAVVDLDAEQVVWAARGSFRHQHDPKLLGNGRLLLFDNRGADPYSRVLELDPLDLERVEWSYAGSAERPFFSATCGSAERLPNGNTLITESDAGRAFEVTPDGETVWEFVNPHRAGDAGELVATLFELLRLPPDFPVEWPASRAASR